MILLQQMMMDLVMELLDVATRQCKTTLKQVTIAYQTLCMLKMSGV
jgi:hypothetical protein